MEQARYWMWTKREHSLCRVQVSTNSSCNSSWEEQAFAEDAAGSLGGCIWPPRSYSCSFCRREFKSAQALGGHMNVHRRDRARLKQSSICHNEILHPHNQNLIVQNPCIPLSVPYPPQVCNLLYNPNPNYDQKFVASPSRDSAPTTQENCSEHTLFSSSHSSSVIREHQNGSFISSPPSCLNSVPIKPDLLLGLDLVVHQNGQTGSGTEQVETKGCKRRRTDGSLLYPFLESSSVHSHHIQSEAPGLTSIEDLDLELRLGDRPKSNCKRSANEGNLRDTQ